MNKRILVPGILFAGVLIAVGIFTSLNLTKSADLSTTLRSSQWTQNVGSGVSVPACSSASPSVTCSGGTAQVNISWSYGGQHGTCTSVSISLSDGQSASNQPCSGSYTFNVANSTNYTYTINWIGPVQTCIAWDKNGCTQYRTDYVTIDSTSGSFGTPACIPAPTASISANPSTIREGESTTLSWSSTNADSCSIDQGIGGVPTSGSRSVSPSSNTTYTLTCTGPGGSAQSSVPITVIPRPRVTLQAIPAGPIEVPNSINLNWSSTSADSCVASGDWGGSKAPSGSEAIVKPRGTYTFTITCSGPGGTSDPSSVTVRVIQMPQCSFSANPPNIILPETSTLSWSCQYAQSCTINQDIGPVNNVSGSNDVRPPLTTIYTLNCGGLDGYRSWQATVGVGFIPKLKEILPK